MSVVGFDFGNESGIVAVAGQRKIDVLLNDEFKRETPALVCFGDKQRFIGSAASNMINPISQIKRLIGRPFSDPALQQDIKSLSYDVTEGPDGYPLIHATYLGEVRTFTPTQVLGMVFSDLKRIAEKNLNAAVVDCCIGIPVYFSDLQRRAVMDAATIAGLHPLRLFHETTATALAYGIYKTDLPESDQINVAFVDIGHASMQVCIVGLKKGQLKILSHSFDRNLGGRDFDEALFQHFAQKLKEEYKINVYKNASDCIMLRYACEKLKRVLSTNSEAALNIKHFTKENVKCFMNRDEFEQISVPILERVKKPLNKALLDAGLIPENIHSVEVVGSGSRVPAIIKILTEVFNEEPKRTMNASECVAIGCALQCAILSPRFEVWEFQVHESFPFSIALSWKGSSLDSQNGRADNHQSTVVFPKGNPIPSTKALTFYRSGIFSIDVHYPDADEVHAQAKISAYTIGPIQTTKIERAKVMVKAFLNLHGIVSIESATLLEEEDVSVVKDPVKESTKMETDEAKNNIVPPANSETDINMQDAEVPVSRDVVENGGTETGEKLSQMETDSKAEAPKKVANTIISVAELVYGGMLPSDVQKAIEKEFEMAQKDRIMKERKDKKNALNGYVVAMAGKVDTGDSDEMTDSFYSLLSEVYPLLCEDEDETEVDYSAKLVELKKQGDPLEERYNENLLRGILIDELVYSIYSFREAAMSIDPEFEHIAMEEKQKVLNECVNAEGWLQEKKLQQDTLPKYAPPVLSTADVRKKAEVLDSICRPIMTKAKSPAKPATLELVCPQPSKGSDTPS